jgi:hypothetical protein
MEGSLAVGLASDATKIVSERADKTRSVANVNVHEELLALSSPPRLVDIASARWGFGEEVTGQIEADARKILRQGA